MYLNQVRARARGDRTVTLGFTPERLDERISDTVLGLGAGSRVFARYVGPGTEAYAVGLRGFESTRDDEIAGLPVRVVSLSIIEAVNGTPVATPADFLNAVEATTPGAAVALDVLQVSHPEGGGPTTQSVG
ncbi:MAG: hypothetical protein GWN71_22570, partial [Gammaproteobacteria bacterium]|nr:hypothetical protein [Gemmatimonadota bacterium]NIU76243.1 hypothetical protein [Gammaproteobacteria bacterium]NIW75411.1 hypothetical protein [Gemmatimonadota bacterium]